MWKCKHCDEEFDFEKSTHKANHTRHCHSNPNKEKSYTGLSASQLALADKKLGIKKKYEVECAVCMSTFSVIEREHQFPKKDKYYCGKKCANNRQEWWNSNAVSYKTIALQHHAHKCVICGFDKIVAIHHIDENKKNNHPHNLIPLCPNHHEMVHSRYRNEVQPHIDEWQNNLKPL